MGSGFLSSLKACAAELLPASAAGRAALCIAVVLGIAMRCWLAFHPPFEGGMWIDEYFSTGVAMQPPARVIEYAAADIHPPLYYLVLSAWNHAGEVLFQVPPPEVEFGRFVHEDVLTAGGRFEIFLPDGEKLMVMGPGSDTWPAWPLAPLPWLRLLGVPLGLAGAALLLVAGRRFLPEEPGAGPAAAALWMLWPFVAAWDAALRSYSLTNLLVLATGLALLRWGRAGRPAMGATVVAVLTAAGLLSNYIVLMVGPALGLAALLLGADNRRRGWLLGGLAGGLAIAAVLWGGAFLAQLGLERAPTRPQTFAEGFALGARVLAWRNSHWFFTTTDTAALDMLRTPVLWGAAAVVIVALVAGAALRFRGRRPTRAETAILVLAAVPQLTVLLANSFSPHLVPHEARHLSIVLPWYALLLAGGGCWVTRRMRGRFPGRD